MDRCELKSNYEAAEEWCSKVVKGGHELLFDVDIFDVEMKKASKKFEFPAEVNTKSDEIMIAIEYYNTIYSSWVSFSPSCVHILQLVWSILIDVLLPSCILLCKICITRTKQK
jgi:hypothetical protein